MTNNKSDLNKLNLPSILEDIVTKNKDIYAIELTSDDDLQATIATHDNWNSVTKNIPVKLTIRNWYPITLRVNKSKIWFVVGEVAATEFLWNTSPVIMTEPDLNGVFTKSGSHYRLEQRGKGEPPEYIVHSICRTMRTWGLSSAMGSPHIDFL